YFSPEFGIAEALPQYSGGLGVLAGDHLKAASDLGVPLVGVGLFYREGYFRQELSVDGWQQERYPVLDPFAMALTPENDKRITVAGMKSSEAVEAGRAGTIFTTHTPVPAGIDRFPRELMQQYFSDWCEECGIGLDDLMEIGHFPGEPVDAPFNMAVMGLRLAG